MKSQWKPREKAMQNPQNQVCAKKCQKNGFAILWPIFLMSAPALCGCCWSCGADFFFSRYESFEAFSHLGPLL